MITTRQVNVNLSKEKLKLRQVTTKDIDAGVRVEPPKEPIKVRGVSTTTLPDVAAIIEKKRRDDIATEKKLMIKDEKKIAMAEKKDREIEVGLKTSEPDHGDETDSDPKDKEVEVEKEKKKPWKLMTNEEKKVAIKERTAKMMTTKAKKKK